MVIDPDECQTATLEAKLSYVYSILKPHVHNSSYPVQLLQRKTKRSYEYSILKSYGQSSKSPVRLLSREAKQSYVYTILKKHNLSRVGPKQLCALAHQGSTSKAAYFLIHTKFAQQNIFSLEVSS